MEPSEVPFVQYFLSSTCAPTAIKINVFDVFIDRYSLKNSNYV